jgi:hypothetical protein
VNGKSPYSFLAERKSIEAGSTFLLALLLAVVVGGHKPDVPDRGQRHAVAVVLYRENRITAIKAIERNHNRSGVGIVCVFYQLKDGEPGSSD